MCCPTLDSCCCCCSLRIGTIVVAVFDAVAAVGVLSASITQINDNSVPDDVSVSNSYISSAVFAGIYVLMCVLLLFGALCSSRKMMWPWMVYTYIFMASYFINMIIASIPYFRDDYVWSGVGLIISAIANIFLQYYFFLVVYSYYRKVQPTPSAPSGNFARGQA